MNKSRMPLQPEAVARAALRLVNEVGLDGLTTRRLATELQIQSPSLYWHFSSKQELLNCMAEVMVTDALADLHPPEPNQDWADWLASYARLTRRMALGQRDGARVLAEADLARGSFGKGIDLAVQTLHAAGFAPHGALRSALAVFSYTLGGVFALQSEPSSSPLMGDQEAVQPQTPAVDMERFPTLARFMDESDVSLASEEWFDEGLELMLDGMRASLARETQRREHAQGN
jgi:TetR/AcrR family tetracycline transcriptional repressor